MTLVPFATSAWHVAPQSMPAGLVTEPMPAPAVATVRWTGSSANVAVTDFAAFIATVQVAEAPVQAPLQPVKVEPGGGCGRERDARAVGEVAWHVAPQSMPAGLVTVPLPVPAVATVSWTGSARTSRWPRAPGSSRRCRWRRRRRRRRSSR